MQVLPALIWVWVHFRNNAALVNATVLATPRLNHFNLEGQYIDVWRQRCRTALMRANMLYICSIPSTYTLFIFRLRIRRLTVTAKS